MKKWRNWGNRGNLICKNPVENITTLYVKGNPITIKSHYEWFIKLIKLEK